MGTVVRSVQREDIKSDRKSNKLIFSEYCEKAWEKELYDWQRDILDSYYEQYKNRDPNTQPYVARGSGRTSINASLLLTLNLYLDYLEDVDAEV